MATVRTLSEAKAAETGRALAHGRCACGTVQFRVRVDRSVAAPCICRRCRGQGLKIAYADRDDFRLLTGADDLTEPLADARTPHHFFCARCGEAGFGFPAPGQVSVNLAFLDRGAASDTVEDGL